MQEVVDFRYFKVTSFDKDNPLELKLRFDKYKDYREWGSVILEATLSDEEIQKQFNRPIVEEIEKEKMRL